MNTTRALGLAGAVLATAAVGGVAYAADSTGSSTGGTPATTAATTTAATTTPAPGATPKAGHHHRALAGRALHGTFTVQRKGKPTVVDVQRGSVTLADATSVTVRSTDGFETAYGLASTTHIRKDKKPATAAALTPGTKVAIVAGDNGGHPVARIVRVTR